MNEANRLLIVFVSAAAIVTMAVLIFVTWAAPDEAIDRVGDFAEFLSDNNTTAAQALVTLAALVVAVIGLLLIIVELAPDDEPRELRVEQAGATTIIPADALRMRLEEALLTLPDVTAARSRVWSRNKGIAANLELAVAPHANVATVTQEAARIVIDTVQTDLGLPVVGVPSVKIAFAGSRPGMSQRAAESTDRGRHEPHLDMTPPPGGGPAAGHADASPGPLVYEETSSEPGEPQ